MQSETPANSELLRFRAIDQGSYSLISGFLLILLLAGALPPLALICIAGVPLTFGVLSRRSAIKSGSKTAGRTRAFAGLILGVLGVTLGVLASNDQNHMMDKARKVTAHAMASSIEMGTISFDVDYNLLPSKLGTLNTNSPDGIVFLSVLLGLERQPPILNSRSAKYLVIKEGKNGKGGIIYTPDGNSVLGLFDPWGNGFTVFLDTDDDNTLSFRLGNRQVELKDRRVAVFSPGTDHKEGTADDVRTW